MSESVDGSGSLLDLWLASHSGYWLPQAFRVYLHFFNNYTATYGSLGAAVILMLWLYLTGFAILIGGEVNQVIENEDKKAAAIESKKRQVLTQMKAA